VGLNRLGEDINENMTKRIIKTVTKCVKTVTVK